MAYTARRIPSPRGAGRGQGRGVPGQCDIVFRQCFQGFPLSPALSPLVPRGERERRKRRLLPVALSPVLRTSSVEAAGTLMRSSKARTCGFASTAIPERTRSALKFIETIKTNPDYEKSSQTRAQE